MSSLEIHTEGQFRSVEIVFKKCTRFKRLPSFFYNMTMTMFLFYIIIFRKELCNINKLGNVMY